MVGEMIITLILVFQMLMMCQGDVAMYAACQAACAAGCGTFGPTFAACYATCQTNCAPLLDMPGPTGCSLM